MTEAKPKKLSRRDAIKVIGAVAGASVLANLPSKWTKPELATGVLPAHAQTSQFSQLGLVCNTFHAIDAYTVRGLVIGVNLSSAQAGIVLNWSIVLTGGASFVNPAEPTSGTAVTVFTGNASYNGGDVNTPAGSGWIVTWSFNNPSDGSGTCNQVATFN